MDHSRLSEENYLSYFGFLRLRPIKINNDNMNISYSHSYRRRLQRDMCSFLRTRLPQALAVGRVLLPAEFHVRRSHCHRAGRAALCRRFRHQHVGAIPTTNVFRRVHADTAGIYIYMIITMDLHCTCVGVL